MYVLLTRWSYFKDNQAISFLVALSMAIMSLFNPIVIKTINMMAPWFVLVFIFMLLVFMAYTAFGIQEKTIIDTITKGKYAADFGYWVLAIVLIIGIGSLTTVISEEQGFLDLSSENGSIAPVGHGETSGFWDTVFHPQLLGMVVILLIGLFTVSRLSAKGS